jgi:DNA ligase-1
MKTFPTLYQLDKKNQLRVWKIWVVKNIIYTESGLDSGQKVQTVDEIKQGKNIGRANETSKEEQALAEAQSKWNKKNDGHAYSTSIPKVGAISYSPMLAQEFKKQKAKVKFPCYIQPKLDGYRAVYDGINDRILTRTNKEYSILYGTPLHTSLQRYKGLVLDGELYIHDKEYDFENYGILRKKKLNPGDLEKLKAIKYNVYDIINHDTFEKRFTDLKGVISNNSNVSLVETLKCKDLECIDEAHVNFMKKGYEGTMVRNANGLYSHKRSSDLLKYKNFDDAEFKVVGFTHEKDTKGDGLLPVVWICETKNGTEFNVASKGTRQERDKLFKSGNKYIGKQLSVQFFGLTNGGVPRFPKTLREGVASFRVQH